MSINEFYLCSFNWEQFYSDEDVLTIKSAIEINTSIDDELPVGNVQLYVFDKYWKTNIIEAADTTSSANEYILGKLLGKEEKYEIEEFSRVGLIDRIYIKEEYRGNGLGTDVFKKVNWYLNSIMNSDIICLTAMPIDERGLRDSEEVNEFDLNRLIQWYSQFGYQKVDPEDKSNDNLLFIDARYKNQILGWE